MVLAKAMQGQPQVRSRQNCARWNTCQLTMPQGLSHSVERPLMAKLDLKSKYRMVPVHPADQALLGIRWEGQTFIDLTGQCLHRMSMLEMSKNSTFWSMFTPYAYARDVKQYFLVNVYTVCLRSRACPRCEKTVPSGQCLISFNVS